MNTLVLFEGTHWRSLFPLTLLKPTCELRVGYRTISQSWMALWNSVSSLFYTTPSWDIAEYFESHEPDNTLSPTMLYCEEPDIDSLSDILRTQVSDDEAVLAVCGGLLPTLDVVKQVQNLQVGEALYWQDELLAFRGVVNKYQVRSWQDADTSPRVLRKLWHLFSYAELGIALDFASLAGSEPLPSTVRVIGDRERVYIAQGAHLYDCTLNVEEGPIIVGSDATIMEGAHVRGPLAMASHAQLKMGAKVYGATVLGNYCKVGGEVNNVVFQSFSSKAHDGFLGNSAIGSWCNLGADTNASNLKNTYSPVRIWNMAHSDYEDTGLLFCGLFLGDHSKTGINTMFNTGSVVGVYCNVYGSGFPRSWVPSFSSGGRQGYIYPPLSALVETARVVMGRRNEVFSAGDYGLVRALYGREVELEDNEQNA